MYYGSAQFMLPIYHKRSCTSWIFKLKFGSIWAYKGLYTFTRLPKIESFSSYFHFDCHCFITAYYDLSVYVQFFYLLVFVCILIIFISSKYNLAFTCFPLYNFNKLYMWVGVDCGDLLSNTYAC